MRVELGTSNVDHHVDQLLLPPQLLEHAEGQRLDVLGDVDLAVGRSRVGDVAVGLCTAFRAVHTSRQPRAGRAAGGVGLLEALGGAGVGHS